jgi:hypothetical protein
MGCWCCGRRQSTAPRDCGEGYCLRCSVCPTHCRCPNPWIVCAGEDDGSLYPEDDEGDEPAIVEGPQGP